MMTSKERTGLSEKTTPEASSPGSGNAGRKPRARLAPSQKYEVFTAVLTNAATQRELAEKYRIDRSTIQGICKTAKSGALDALAQAVPGRPRGTSPEQAELAEARERIARLEKTIAEQAMQLHLIEGKGAWSDPAGRSVQRPRPRHARPRRRRGRAPRRLHR